MSEGRGAEGVKRGGGGAGGGRKGDRVLAKAKMPEYDVNEDPLFKKALLMKQRAAERKGRLLNPKLRQLGVDTASLQRQQVEKLRLAEEAKNRDRAYDQQALDIDRRLVFMEQEKGRMARQAMASDNQFRAAHQQKSMRRDQDLDDQRILKNFQPPRVNDTDYIPVGSMQRFEGEDLGIAARVKQQKEQLLSDLANQEAEHAQQKATEAAELESYRELLRRQKQMRDDLFNASEAQRIHNNVSQRVYNQDLAARQEELRKLQAEIDDAEKRAELRKMQNDPMLNEDQTHRYQAIGTHRFARPGFRSMDPAIVSQINQGREEQVKEMARNREAARQEKLQDALDLKAQNEAWYRAQMTAEAARKAAAVHVGQTHKLQQDEKKDRDARRNAILAPELRPDFFGQFGTSDR